MLNNNYPKLIIPMNNIVILRYPYLSTRAPPTNGKTVLGKL
jgi:hypothetical protein